MADMKFSDEGGAAPEDMMERLLREQTYAANGDEDDEDAMPDWAADGDDSLNTNSVKTGLGFPSGESQQPTAKRSLLLEVSTFIIVFNLPYIIVSDFECQDNRCIHWNWFIETSCVEHFPSLIR